MMMMMMVMVMMRAHIKHSSSPDEQAQVVMLAHSRELFVVDTLFALRPGQVLQPKPHKAFLAFTPSCPCVSQHLMPAHKLTLTSTLFLHTKHFSLFTCMLAWDEMA